MLRYITPALFLVACSASETGDSDGSGTGGVGSSQGEGASTGTGGDLEVGTGGEDGGVGDPNICESYAAVSEAKTPAVLLLLDQSGSMTGSRWTHAKDAITAAATSLEAFAHVGFVGFPIHPLTNDTEYANTCGAEMKVAPGPSSAASIIASLHPTAPSIGHTPVRAALSLAQSELSQDKYATMPKYVVLITDGAPNCASSSPGSFWKREDPSDTVTEMSTEGITTYVVGYQLSKSESDGIVPWDVANNMAVAGGTESFRDVADGVALTAELADIRAQVVPCSFELDAAPRGGETYVRVTIDEQDFELATDWSLQEEQTVALDEEGAACQLLRDGAEHSVNIQVECEPVVVK